MWCGSGASMTRREKRGTGITEYEVTVYSGDEIREAMDDLIAWHSAARADGRQSASQGVRSGAGDVWTNLVLIHTMNPSCDWHGRPV